MCKVLGTNRYHLYAVATISFQHKIVTMKKIEPKTVKPNVVKSLKSKLIGAVHKALKDNKVELTDKIQKVVNKSIKKIVKKTDEKLKKAVEAI